MIKQLVINLLQIYHLVFSFDRGLLAVFAPGGACKYSPSCSVYTRQMVEEHGVIKGLRLGLRQFLSCR